MKKFIRYIIPILCVMTGCSAQQTPPPTLGAKIIVWDKGKDTELKCSYDIDQLKESLLTIIEKSDDMLQLIVMDKRIKELKGKNYCLEVIFNTPLKAHIGGEEISFTNFFIPVNKDRDVHSIVFYLGDYKHYFTPPYVSSQGKEDLLKLLESLNMP